MCSLGRERFSHTTNCGSSRHFVWRNLHDFIDILHGCLHNMWHVNKWKNYGRKKYAALARLLNADEVWHPFREPGNKTQL